MLCLKICRTFSRIIVVRNEYTIDKMCGCRDEKSKSMLIVAGTDTQNTSRLL